MADDKRKTLQADRLRRAQCRKCVWSRWKETGVDGCAFGRCVCGVWPRDKPSEVEQHAQ